VEIKILAKNTVMLSLPKVLKFLFGIIRAKIIAVYLGTGGAGIIVQLQNILQNISGFTTPGMPDGMVRQLASANAKKAPKQEIVNIIRTYAITVSVITAIVYICGFIFAKLITRYVFGDTKYYNYFLIGFTAFPILILSSSSFAIIKAYKRIKSLMFAELVISSVNFVFFVILIYFFRLTGAVVYVTLSFFWTYIVYRYIARQKILKVIGIRFTDIIKAQFDFSHFRELMAFVGATLTGGIYTIFVDITESFPKFNGFLYFYP